MLTQGQLPLPFMRKPTAWELASPYSRSAFQTAVCVETTAIFRLAYFEQQRKRRSAAMQPGSRPAHEAARLCPPSREEMTWVTSWRRRTTRVSGAAAGAARRAEAGKPWGGGLGGSDAVRALWGSVEAARRAAVRSPSPRPNYGFKNNKDSPPPSRDYPLTEVILGIIEDAKFHSELS